MRILHVSEPTSEGTAAVVRQLARAARADGNDVMVASPVGGDLAQWCAVDGIEWRECRLSRRSLNVRAIVQIARWMRRYDVIYLHSSWAGLFGRVAAVFTGARSKVIFMPHGWSWLASRRFARIFRIVEWLAAPWAAAVVAVSETEASAGRSVLGRRAPIVAIPNGIDVAKIEAEPESRDPDTVLCVGRLSVQKGQDRLLHALGQHGFGGTLRFVGSGPEEDALRALADDYGVASRVDFVGQVADARMLFDGAGVVVFPSRWEGLSMALLEAMASGAAIVASESAAVEVLRDGEGIRVPERDESDFLAGLARSVGAVQADRELAVRLGHGARQRVLSTFTVDQMLARHRELDQTIVDRAGRGSARPK